MDDEDDEPQGVNCQPIFIDEDSDDDPTQANGDDDNTIDWRRWTE